MAKYIDADKLLDIIIKMQKEYATQEVTEDHKGLRAVLGGQCLVLTEIIKIIDSLPQEQTESSNGKFVFPKFLYARTVDNKTIDVSYAPQSMDAVEYIKNEPFEQPCEDLEEEMDRFFEEMPVHEHENIFEDTYHMIARHFYEFRKNSK